MRVLIMALIFALSNAALSLPTKEIPNARTLFKLEKKRTHKTAWRKTFLPIPILSGVFSGSSTWPAFRDSRRMYYYFKSAYILKKKEKYKLSRIEKAEKKLYQLLDAIKKKVKEEVQRDPHALLAKGQKTVTERAQSLTLKDLRRLLNKVDSIIPQIIGDAELYYANHSLKDFIYSFYTVDNPKAKKPISILEASIKREKVLIKSKLKDSDTSEEESKRLKEALNQVKKKKSQKKSS